MIKEIATEIVELTKDRRFNRNLALVLLITLIPSVELNLGGFSPERTTQKEKLENYFELKSVGSNLRSQTTNRK